MNKLHVGDNLSIMREMESSSVDLVVTDPPFFSQKNYGDFDDKWICFDTYKKFMISRCIEMYRLLKDTGSLFLHCDPTASHYLKVELDKIFGRKSFRNEIIWSYTRARPGGKQFARLHDVIFWYSKGTEWTFHKKLAQVPLSKEALTVNKIKRKDGKIWIRKRNTKDMSDVWDIKFHSGSKERLGYATQKPIELYERIIQICSNQNDIVLDPFCGSGTTLVAAKLLRRKYIGIDQNEKAIKITTNRLESLI